MVSFRFSFDATIIQEVVCSVTLAGLAVGLVFTLQRYNAT